GDRRSGLRRRGKSLAHPVGCADTLRLWIGGRACRHPAGSGQLAMIAGYQAIGVLVLGAVVLLLLVGRISTRPREAAFVGLPFAVVAGALGLQAPQPLRLAVVALCAVSAIGLLLVPVLEAAVPEHVAEAAALLLLGTAGA